MFLWPSQQKRRMLLYDIAKKQASGVDKVASSNDGTWLDIERPSLSQLREVSVLTGIDVNVLHHAIDDDEHPRVSEAGKYTIIVLRVPFVSDDGSMTTSCAMLLGKKRLISLHMQPLNRIRQTAMEPIHAKTPGEVFFHIIDEVLRQYFSLSEVMDNHLDEVEEEIFKGTDNDEVIQEVFHIKKSLIFLYKAATANRELLLKLENGAAPQLGSKELVKMRYLYHDNIQLIDMLETLRELVTSTMEIYMSSISNKLNEDVKRLTVYGSLVLVPTLIASIYGMNFRNMPELYWNFGYVFALGLMLVSVVITWWHFKRKKWV